MQNVFAESFFGRLVLLLTTRSWLGKKDYGLETELRAELTGTWSLDGLRRLTFDNENHFTRFEAAEVDLALPRCKLDPDGPWLRATG